MQICFKKEKELKYKRIFYKDNAVKTIDKWKERTVETKERKIMPKERKIMLLLTLLNKRGGIEGMH